MNKLQKITATGKKVFTAQDLGVLWDYHDESKLYELIKHYVRTKSIFSVSRGLYSLYPYLQTDVIGDPELLIEIANKIVPNSYVSLVTALKIKGALFQYYDGIYSVASRKVERKVCGIPFVYQKIKDVVLYNDLGIENLHGLRVANLERALCDNAYFDPLFLPESLESCDKEKLIQVAHIYHNQQLLHRIEKWIRK